MRAGSVGVAAPGPDDRYDGGCRSRRAWRARCSASASSHCSPPPWSGSPPAHPSGGRSSTTVSPHSEAPRPRRWRASSATTSELPNSSLLAQRRHVPSPPSPTLSSHCPRCRSPSCARCAPSSSRRYEDRVPRTRFVRRATPSRSGTSCRPPAPRSTCRRPTRCRRHRSLMPARWPTPATAATGPRCTRESTPRLRTAVVQGGLLDVYLIDATNASSTPVAKGPDLGTSLAVGPFSGSIVARAADAAVASADGIVTDLSFYRACPGSRSALPPPLYATTRDSSASSCSPTTAPSTPTR